MRRARIDRRQAGTTLIELVVSLVVVSVALVGTLQVVTYVTRSSADPVLLHQAAAIADSHLEEILLRDFYDPDLGAGGGVCPSAEASRDLYDNVCDYDGLDDSGPRDQSGSAVAGLSGYRVRVDVDTTANLGALSGTGTVVRVDVRVTHTTAVDLTLSGYRVQL